MRVVVKKHGNAIRSILLPFSIGDIVNVKDYGWKLYFQEDAYRITSFYKGDSLNCGSVASLPSYFCNEQFANLQWMVKDVGTIAARDNDLVIRICDRNREELLILCHTDCLNECFNVVRKAKKQVEEHIINS